MFNDYSLFRLARERQQELLNAADSGGVGSDGRTQGRSSRRILAFLARLDPGQITRSKSRQDRSGLWPEAGASL